MDISIKKDKRNRGFFFHKSTGLNSSKAKSIALKDITLNSGFGQFYSQNYLPKEYKILSICSYREVLIQIP